MSENKFKIIVAVTLTVLFCGTMPVYALGEEDQGAEPKVQVERTEAGKFFLDFKAAPLINVLNVIASLSGINFVAGKEVAEREVNMTLDNVSLEDALQAISYGSNVSYDFLPERSIYLFRASADSPERPPLMTRVFKLYYVRVTKALEIEADSSSSSSSSSSGSGTGSSSGGGLVTLSQDQEEIDLESSAIYKAVEKILSDRGSVSVDDRTNSLVVTDSEDRLKIIGDAIAQLDRPLDQVLINVLLVETYEDLDRALGVQWGDTDGLLGTVTGAVQDTDWPFRSGGSTIETKSFGDFFSNVGNTFKDSANQFDPRINSGPITTPGTRDFSSFQISVRALEEANKVKILAKPKILVLDNHPALIKIATNAAIGTTTVTTAEGAGTTSTGLERAEVGTILRVTPLINTRDQVTMTVEPTFATVDNSSITLAQPSGDTTVRTARTTLMVNDGQTIALGGLLFSNQSKGERKVPFFGNLPVVGKALFTNTTRTIEDRELILFLSPYIIRDPSELMSKKVPDKRIRYDDEKAPFYQVKKKEWYKRLEEGEEPPIDFESYFDVRKRLMAATMDTLDEKIAKSDQTALSYET
jgi:type II secretory pathway component GspD/PulD (secretin)